MKKYTIMDKKPAVSEEEISKFMNFDQLLTNFDLAKQKQKLDTIRNVTLISIGLVVIAIAVYLIQSKRSAVDEKARKLSATAIVPTKKVPSASEVERTTLNENIIAKKDGELNSNKTQPPKKSQSNINLKQEYVGAEPMDGYPALYSYFDTTLEYPVQAIRDSIQGVETVAFVINTAGKAEQVEILNSLGTLFDEEVNRLIYNMPVWKPATLNGKPVKSKVSVPFTFNINKRRE